MRKYKWNITVIGDDTFRSETTTEAATMMTAMEHALDFVKALSTQTIEQLHIAGIVREDV